jgi:hypothetical protein
MLSLGSSEMTSMPLVKACSVYIIRGGPCIGLVRSHIVESETSDLRAHG